MSRKLKQVISCQSFSPISDVRDGIIVTKDGKFVKLMEFSPINYGLRSNEDKNMITAQYAAAIRSFPSVVQIKVLSNRANVEHYISGMVESVRHEKNDPLSNPVTSSPSQTQLLYTTIAQSRHHTSKGAMRPTLNHASHPTTKAREPKRPTLTGKNSPGWWAGCGCMV